MPKRMLIVVLAALAAPAGAETLKEVTTHGIIMEANGARIDIDFTHDGRFTAFSGAATGRWRTEGEKLCSIPDASSVETCAVYPKNKTSGDRFALATEQGEVFVTIK